ncbi:MAG: hypothetical protein QM715_18295 [Nibricoccus sp.]
MEDGVDLFFLHVPTTITIRPLMKPAQPSIFSMPGKLFSWIVVAVVFIGLAWRQHAFVDRYAVNVMYWDQWGIYGPMFEERGWWAGFDFQHGPHRQGAGFLVTRVLAEASDWNSRWDAFGVSWVLIAAAGAGLILAWRCGARNAAALAMVPLLYLNIRQYEQFAGPSNISHGAMPLLLLTLYGLAWFVKTRGLRLGLLTGLTFLAIFTGFGFYVGGISLVLFGLESVQLARQKDRRGAIQAALALAAVVASWGLFFCHYKTETAATGFSQVVGQVGQTLRFVGVMLANAQGVWGAGWVATTTGLVVFGLLVALCFYQGVQLVRVGVAKTEPRSVVFFSLTAFVATYCVSAALGRLGEGIEAARASRYVTLMVPAGLAFCLQLSAMKQTWSARGLFAGYFGLLLILTVQLRPGDLKQAESFRATRVVWAQTYLETRDIRTANEKAGQEIFPGSTVQAQVDYLQEHRLNFFKNAGK